MKVHYTPLLFLGDPSVIFLIFISEKFLTTTMLTIKHSGVSFLLDTGPFVCFYLH